MLRTGRSCRSCTHFEARVAPQATPDLSTRYLFVKLLLRGFVKISMRLFGVAAQLLLASIAMVSAAAGERWESRDPSPLVDAVLILNDDRTYRYANQTGSCWLDWDDRGKWYVSDDGLLVLESETQIDWPVSTMQSERDPSVAGIRITLLDDAGKALGGAQILLGDGSVAGTTDAQGHIQLSPDDLARVVGRLEWISFVHADGAAFVRAPASTNSHQIRLSPRRREQARRTNLMLAAGTLKQLGGLRITFERCP